MLAPSAAILADGASGAAIVEVDATTMARATAHGGAAVTGSFWMPVPRDTICSRASVWTAVVREDSVDVHP
jgi:hypothetical protein